MKENKVNVKLILNDSEKICEANIGDNLLDIIRKNNIDFDTPCNGNGSCGKCRCKIKENTEIGASSKKHLNKSELISGIRLACDTEIKSDLTVELSNKIKDMTVLISGVEKEFKINPSVQKHYIVLEKPTLDDQRDDLMRIKDFLKEYLKIENIDIWNLIFDNLKVNSSWENILSYYKTNNSIETCLGGFINNPEVCKELLKDTLYKESINNDEKEIIDLFVEKFVMSKIISDEIVDLLSCKLGITFTDFDFEDMLDSRILVLINKNLIALTESIYRALKNDYHGLHINLIEKNIDQFISGNIQDFDSNDMESILKSEKISKENKYDIIKLYGEDIEINDSLAEIIFDIIEKFLPDEEIKYKLIEDIIRCQFDKEKRIKLIAYQIDFIDKMNISNLLSYIDKEYDGLLDLSHKKMYIENTNANRLILGKLKSKKYISTFNPERSRIVVNRRRT